MNTAFDDVERPEYDEDGQWSEDEIAEARREEEDFLRKAGEDYAAEFLEDPDDLANSA